MALVCVALGSLRALGWLLGALTGERRRARLREQLRQSFADRPPLGDAAFLGGEAVALAVRRAVAFNCYVPAESLRPDDTRADLEELFLPPPDAHWLDLGGSWLQVVFLLEDDLGRDFRARRIDRAWLDAMRDGGMRTLAEVAFFTGHPGEPGT